MYIQGCILWLNKCVVFCIHVYVIVKTDGTDDEYVSSKSTDKSNLYLLKLHFCLNKCVILGKNNKLILCQFKRVHVIANEMG